MHLFPRKAKKTSHSYYFGEFNEEPLAPFSISTASFEKDFSGEPKHYHESNQKAYLTIRGKGILNVGGEQIELNKEQLIHVEPNEVHFVEKVLEAPLEIVVVLSSKTNDKVIVD